MKSIVLPTFRDTNIGKIKQDYKWNVVYNYLQVIYNLSNAVKYAKRLSKASKNICTKINENNNHDIKKILNSCSALKDFDASFINILNDLKKKQPHAIKRKAGIDFIITSIKKINY